jgi:hypothetical protein
MIGIGLPESKVLHVKVRTRMKLIGRHMHSCIELHRGFSVCSAALYMGGGALQATLLMAADCKRPRACHAFGLLLIRTAVVLI